MALAIPALVVIAVVCAWLISLAFLGVQLQSLAATYTRVLARGDQISQLMQEQLPASTKVEISKSGDFVMVSLTSHRRFPIPHLNKSVDVHGDALARLETLP